MDDDDSNMVIDLDEDDAVKVKEVNDSEVKETEDKDNKDKDNESKSPEKEKSCESTGKYISESRQIKANFCNMKPLLLRL